MMGPWPLLVMLGWGACMAATSAQSAAVRLDAVIGLPARWGVTSVSPTGEHVIVRHEVGAEAGEHQPQLVDVRTGAAKTLCPDRFAYDFAWAPDGRQIALLTLARGGRPPVGLEVVDLSGKGLHRMRLHSDDLSWAGALTWSPDGKCLAYCDESSATCSPVVVLVDVETGARETVIDGNLTHSLAWETVADLDWSPGSDAFFVLAAPTQGALAMGLGSPYLVRPGPGGSMWAIRVPAMVSAGLWARGGKALALLGDGRPGDSRLTDLWILPRSWGDTPLQRPVLRRVHGSPVWVGPETLVALAEANQSREHARAGSLALWRVVIRDRRREEAEGSVGERYAHAERLGGPLDAGYYYDTLLASADGECVLLAVRRRDGVVSLVAAEIATGRTREFRIADSQRLDPQVHIYVYRWTGDRVLLAIRQWDDTPEESLVVATCRVGAACKRPDSPAGQASLRSESQVQPGEAGWPRPGEGG